MRLAIILFFFLTVSLQAQINLETGTGVVMPSGDTTISIPDVPVINNAPIIDIRNPLEDPKPFSIELPTDLVDAGAALEKKWKDKDIKDAYKHDQYLGDFKTKGSFVSIECRDHEYVDGDKVRVLVNGEVVESVITLASWFKGINVDLKPGFNQIEFVALNQGASGPNTAQFRVFDAAGLLITSQEWNLTKGAKASIIVVR